MVQLRLVDDREFEYDAIPFPIDRARNAPGRDADAQDAIRAAERAIDDIQSKLDELEGLISPLPFRAYARDDDGPSAA
ncbi:MAG: hypothetical protein EA423_02995 [Phycisphaerales bacterium]|nr:MAG: hypothetical protein EA423_02995 [Phycisphaerales bacterium]